MAFIFTHNWMKWRWKITINPSEIKDYSDFGSSETVEMKAPCYDQNKGIYKDTIYTCKKTIAPYLREIFKNVDNHVKYICIKCLKYAIGVWFRFV